MEHKVRKLTKLLLLHSKKISVFKKFYRSKLVKCDSPDPLTLATLIGVYSQKMKNILMGQIQILPSVLNIASDFSTCFFRVSCPYVPGGSHCSRITHYPSFISQDFFHFSLFIHNGDNLNM